jgi:CRP/FNR family transcriptional regulator, cyclic AMP receptor protein
VARVCPGQSGRDPDGCPAGAPARWVDLEPLPADPNPCTESDWKRPRAGAAASSARTSRVSGCDAEDARGELGHAAGPEVPPVLRSTISQFSQLKVWQVGEPTSVHAAHSWDDPPEMSPKPPSVRTAPLAFDVQAFLRSAGVPQRTVRFAAGAVVFAQGAHATSVFYVQEGGVKLSVISSGGKEAVVAMLGPGDFVGEGCLAGQPLRIGTATAVMKTALLRIPKRDMVRMLHENSEFSDRFIAHMLTRNIRIEEDLVDQLFNSSEKRLARTLLLLARYGKEDTTPRVLPKLTQETLAEMVGTTRSRVNFFMNKFRKLGLIEYNGGLKVNSSLLSIVLHD